MQLCPALYRRLSLLTAIAGVCLLAVPSTPAHAASRASQTAVAASSPGVRRITEAVDETRLTTLTGNTRSEARAEFDRGSVAPELVMGDLFLVLRRGPEQQAAFEAFLASQQDPASANYHRWLTPDEIGTNFGPAQADIDTVSHWLLNHGFTIDSVSKDRMFIRFDGAAGQVASAFHTEIHNLNVHGESHIANMSDPKIPEALTPVVVGVKALHNFFPHTLHKLGASVRRKPDGSWERIGDPAVKASRDVPAAANAKQVKPLFGTGGTPATIEDVAPYDLATIYNILPLWNASTPIDGTGQSIAIAGRSNITLSDVATFRSQFGLPAKVPQVIITNTDPGACPGYTADCQGDLVENTLDVEWSGAVAKNANIILVTSSASSSTSDGSFISEQYIIDKVTAKIMNVSYGECELGLEASGNAAYTTLWSSAQGEGIAVFVATGDSGSATCDSGMDTSTPYGAEFGLSVSGIASTAYNTAVGGTDFIWGWSTTGMATYWGTSDTSSNKSNALGYIPEFPWNGSCGNSLYVALVNSEISGATLDAGEVCDDIATGKLTASNGQSLEFLVDTVGGGGGASHCINGDGENLSSCTKGNAKPTFQSGVIGIPADGVRDIPDLSLFAANGFSGSAYVICVSAAGTCSYDQATEPTGEEVGGTSVASPIVAGIMALINQKAGSTQGNPNAQLYKLAAAENYSGCSSNSVPLTGSACVFNDISTGGNAVPCAVGSLNCTSTDETEISVLSGYSAGVGYDLASGLGSVNVTNLVNAFAPATSAPSVSLTPSSLAFAATDIGVSASAQVVTLKNTGTASLTIGGISITGVDATSFSEVNTCGTAVAASASCTITVTFKPAASGSLTASLSIADNASGSPQAVALTGTGVVVGPVVALSPASLTFASTLTGSSAPVQSVTLTNTGNEALTSVAISVTGAGASSYSQTNTCGTSVAVGATCTIAVEFTPAATGSLTATLTIADNATGSPQTVALIGTGIVPAPSVSLTPTSLVFGSTEAGSSAAAQAVTLKNTGTAALSITGITVTGTNAASFTQSNTCGTSVAVGATCTIAVVFTPATGGSLSAAITIADNATGSPQTVALIGTGVVPAPSVSLTPTTLTFGSTAAGASAAAQAVTLKNTGTAALSITGITVTGTNAAGFTQTNTCGTGVAIGATCTITVTFSPTTFSTSAETATITIADNASGSPQTVALSGTATEAGSYTLSAAPVTIAPGSSGSSAITGTGSAGYSTPNTVALSSCTVTNSPAGASDLPTCTITGASVAFATGSTSGTGGSVSIGTTAATTSVKLGQSKAGNKLWQIAGAGGAVAAGLLLFGIPARRRNWRALLGALVFIAAFGALSGCGGSGSSGGGGTSNPGTTAGTYTFTITGTDADGVKATATLTVTVS